MLRSQLRSSRQAGKPELAIRFLRGVIALDPSFASVHTSLRALLEEGGDLAAAAICLRQTASLLPDDADGHDNLRRLLAAPGE